jgi:hypothetical protein
MHSFRIRPDGYKIVKRKMLIYAIPVTVIGILIGSIPNYIMSAGDKNDTIKPETYYADNSIDWLIYLPFVAFAAVIVFGMYRGLARVKKMFESYELSITENLIAREQFNTPTISIYLNEVQEIVKRKNGSYFIKGLKANDLILVPKLIENPAQLESVLETIKPIASKGKGTAQLKLQGILTFISLGLMICVNTVENKIIVATAGTLFIAIWTYNFILTQKSKNVDYRTKRIRWIGLLALLLVIFMMLLKLTDYRILY